MQPSQLVKIRESLENRPLSFEQCIEWARLKFQEEYNNDIRQLLHSLPRDMVSRYLDLLSSQLADCPPQVTDSGTPFWSGPKRAPNPVEFDINNVGHA